MFRRLFHYKRSANCFDVYSAFRIPHSALIFTYILIHIIIIPAFANITVVESTPSRLVLSWELADLDTVSVPVINNNNQQIYRTRLSFRGGHVFTGDSGAALIPAYTFYAGVPAQGNVRVSVEPEEVASMRLNNPLQRRTFVRDTLDPVFTGASWISDPAYTSMREWRVAYLALRPVHDAGRGSVRVLRKARVVIEFPAAPHGGSTWEPRGDYERMVSGLILNYKVAQGWRDRPGLRKAASEKDPHPFRANDRLASFRVGDGHRDGNEASTKENSLIKISGAKVRQLLGGGASVNIPISSVALYASHKGEMNLVPAQEGEIPAGVFEVPILRYDVNGNGIVDDGDYFIAYVSGSSDWSYSPSQTAGEYTFLINRYDDRRTYWLTVKNGAGQTMGKFEQPTAADMSVPVSDHFEDNVYLRTPQALSSRSSSGSIDWVWKRFTAARPDTVVTFDLPEVDIKRPASMRLARGTVSSRFGMNVFWGEDTICEDCDGSWSDVTLLSAGRQSVAVRFNAPSSDAFVDINGLHIRYQRPMSVTPESGKLEAFSSVSDGISQYRVNKSGAVGALAYIVRVPLDEREISLVDTVRQAEYTFADDGNLGVRYMIMLESDIVDYSDSLAHTYWGAGSLTGDSIVRDLRDLSNRTDYLIVTHENFMGAAVKLADHKEKTGFEYPRVVSIKDIMDQFGGGNTDPVALRNFLLYVYRNWNGGAELSYVVLMGSGHYDYKQISTRAANFMPVMYVNDRPSDDFYTFLDTAHPSTQHDGYYFIGRISVKDISVALGVVDKIREMEDPGEAVFDAWRNRVLLTADDDQQGDRQDNIKDHVFASEDVADNLMRSRPAADLRKVYNYEYPWDENYYKPAARRAFINEINNGVSVVNWFGHGSVNQISDEALFSINDIPALYNRKRYPLFSLFSCSIGKYDQPGEESLGTMLVNQPGAGASVVVSSVRDVLGSKNRALSRPFFEALFDDDYGYTIGAALKYAKFKYQDSDNRYYALLGDPSLFIMSRNRLNVTVSVTDGKAPIDTLKALQQITIKGTVAAPAASGKRSAVQNAGTDTVSLALFNPPDSARRKDGGTFSDPKYTLPGTPVFSAKVPVKNGTFEQQILLPMNLAFGKPGVRLSAYAWKAGEAQSGVAWVDDLVFEGSESGNINDTTPPRISIRPVYDDETMDRSGMYVKNRVTAQLPMTLEIKIEDESGINTMGTGPDEGLMMEITGALSKRSINHLFRFSEGNFKQGVAMVQLEENTLKSGTHELVISAQDLLGNVARQTFSLEIVEPTEIKLDHVINVPNPVRMGRETRFYFNHSNTPGDYNVNVTIRVYTLGGRLVAVIRNPKNGEAWVPRDQRGNLLTPNVYLYQVTATSMNVNKTVKSKIKKLVVHPPRK